jgi:hypothetical protein
MIKTKIRKCMSRGGGRRKSDRPVRLRAYISLSLFPASCPVSLALYFRVPPPKKNRLVLYFSMPKRVIYGERELTIYTVRLDFDGLWAVR